MKRTLKSLSTLCLVLALICSMCSFGVSAVAEEVETLARESDSMSSTYGATDVADAADSMGADGEQTSAYSTGRNVISLKTVPTLNASAYQSATVTLNGKSVGVNAISINGTVYIPLRAFINATTNMSVGYNSRTRTLSVSGGGLTLTVTDGSHIVYANGRVLFSMTPSVIMTNGRIYVPIQPIAKALGLSLTESTGRASLWGSVRPLASADSFYREDAVYWLSRIISAESRGEVLHGQIAVGNVVLNRVDSPLYPNTIWGVIFDKKYGVQFSPILDGTIYNTPSANSILAAKICLDGFSISDETLFFLAPKYAQSSWIPRTRTYEFTIGNHDFYS